MVFLFLKSYVLYLLFFCIFCASSDLITDENPAPSLLVTYVFSSDEATKALDSGSNKLNGEIIALGKLQDILVEL